MIPRTSNRWAPRPGRPALLSVTLGVLLLVGATVAWQIETPQTSGPATEAGTAARPDQPAVDREEPAQLPASRPSTPDELVQASPPPPAPPVTLRLAGQAVDAPVDPVALEDDGTMELPEDVQRVGWFEPGVAPGEAAGTAVMSGHVDAASQGRGALFELHDVEPGDAVEVVHADGRTSTWDVSVIEVHHKAALPIEELFTRRGEPRIALITCTGPFDPDARRYRDNLVVLAVPAEAD